MRISKYKNKGCIRLFIGSYGHHYNQRRLNKAIATANRMGLLCLGLDHDKTGLAHRLSAQMKAGLKAKHLKMKDYDFSGFEASRHRFGLEMSLLSAKHEDKYEDLFDSVPKQHQITVPSADADKILDACNPDVKDIGNQGVDEVIYRPDGKATVYYEYSKLDKELDDSDEWYDENRTSLKTGAPRYLCITGAPASGKHTLQHILVGYGYQHGHPEWDFFADDDPDNINAKSEGWISCIVSRKKALSMKKAFKKRVLIVNCTMPSGHWWVPFHRLLKRGLSRKKAKDVLDKYYNDKNYGIDNYYDDLGSISIPIITNNRRNEYKSLHRLFNGETDC